MGLNVEEIIKDYTENNLSVEKIALKNKVGKLKIKQLLKENNIKIKGRGGQVVKRDYLVSDWSNKKYNDVAGYHYVAKYKSDGKEFKDYMNSGGHLTSYIRTKEKVEIPSLYDRRIFYMETGNYWWEQYFDIILVKNKKTKKCPYCDWETIDVDNRSGWFEQHLNKEHKISKDQYLIEFPNDGDYFRFACPTKNMQLELDYSKFVTCKICDKKLTRIDNKHLSSHGIDIEDYIKIYGNDIVSVDLHNRLSKIAVEVNKNMSYKNTYKSKGELEIFDFISGIGLNVISDRQKLMGKELDLFVEGHNIAIEYNGLYYHNELFKYKNYHIEKTKKCSELGIKLVQIFEDEWLYKKDIVKSRLLNMFGLTPNKIHARKCEIREIDSKESVEFLNKNHIQGGVNSKINLGLYYKDELVSLMTFIKKRRSLGHVPRDNEFELLRFCNKINTNVIGGASKLFNYFIKNYAPNNIISYSDLRWSNGDLYEKLGFGLSHQSKPNYFYVIRNKRYNRFNYRKDKLVSQGYDINKSEREIMLERGIYRIYDCGSKVYEWKNSNLN